LFLKSLKFGKTLIKMSLKLILSKSMILLLLCVAILSEIVTVSSPFFESTSESFSFSIFDIEPNEDNSEETESIISEVDFFEKGKRTKVFKDILPFQYNNLIPQDFISRLIKPPQSI
jgi:hypothetical protein